MAEHAVGGVQPVNTELLGVLWLICQEQLQSTAVRLGLLDVKDMVDLEVKSQPFGLVLALVGYQFSLDDFADCCAEISAGSTRASPEPSSGGHTTRSSWLRCSTLDTAR